MPNQFDEIFSIERLRQNWAREEEQKDFAQAGEKSPTPDVMEEFEYLKKRIGDRYLEERETFDFLLEELEQLLKERFLETGEDEILPEKKQELNLAVQEAINQLEDLAEAVEMGRRGRQ